MSKKNYSNQVFNQNVVEIEDKIELQEEEVVIENEMVVEEPIDESVEETKEEQPSNDVVEEIKEEPVVEAKPVRTLESLNANELRFFYRTGIMPQ